MNLLISCARTVAALTALAFVPKAALADEPPSAPAPPVASVTPSTYPSVGGHVGVAVPFATLRTAGDAPTGAFKSSSIADGLTLLNPIGVTVKLSERFAVDFEMVVASSVTPGPTSTGLVIDPGVIYSAGPVALGLRLAFQVAGAPNGAANVGLIPLVHRGLVNFGGGNWFVELALPTFVVEQSIQLNVVLHTGIAF